MMHREPTYRLRMISKTFSLLAFALIFFLAPGRLSATHIVGGEITYRCLGGDRYEVKVAVYRDCINGSALAVFDDPAAVGIFDANNNLQVHLGSFGQLLIPFNADDTLSQATDCVDGMGGVCVQQTFYIDTIQLPYLPGGYQLVYQRCCRNETLVNIVEPLETGTSMVTTITEEALQACNSTPEFREWPPIFICVNEDIAYDHSAMDVDGDSLVYRLCTPLMGATRENPSPNPPLFPPYNEVIWAPGYGVENMLGGSGALTIDADGQLTGTPSSIGQFLVGICVEEYRDGKLMSMTRRDFEYNVVDCDGLVFTNFSVESEVVCADIVDVEITDESFGIDPGAASWSYIVTKENGDQLTFNERNPSFRIEGTGSIDVTQIVNVDTACTTRKTQTINFDTESTGVNDGDTITICSGSSIQLSSDPSDLFTYRWTPERFLDDPTNPNPISTPEESITYTVEIFDPLRGCTIEKTVHIQVILIFNRMADFTVSKECNSTTLSFTNTSLGDEGVYLWDFGDSNAPNATSTEENPTYTYSEPGTYIVSLSLPGDDCNSIRTRRLAVAGDDFVDFDRDISVCGPSQVVIDHGLNPDYIYSWDPNPYFDDLSNPLPDLLLESDASFSVTVVDPLNSECVISGTVSVSVGDQLVVRSVKDSIFSCTGIDVELNPEGDPNLIYEWSPVGLFDDPTAVNPIVTVTETTDFMVMVTDPNDATCTVRFNATVLLGINDGGFDDGDSIVVCSGSSLFLNSGANPNFTYSWTPTDYLEDASIPNPIATPLETITYTVDVTDPDGECSLSKSITIVVVESDVRLGFDVEKECQSRTLDFINQSQNATTYSWHFDDPNNPGFVSNEENPTYTYSESGTYEVELRSNDDPNCLAIAARRLVVLGEEFVDFEKDIDLCGPSLVVLEAPFSAGAIYQWEPNPYFTDLSDPRPEFRISESDSISLRVRAIDPLNEECSVQGVFRIFVDDQLVVETVADTIFSCTGMDVELNPGGDPSLIYSWSPTRLLDDPTAFNPIVSVTQPTTFEVTITDPNDPTCSVRFKSTVTIGVNDGGFEDGDTIVACAGSTLFINTGANPALDYVWSPTIYLDDPTLPNPIAAPEETTTYTVRVTDPRGNCTLTKSITVVMVDSDVLLDFDIEKECDSRTLMFVNRSVNATSYSWDFGDPANPGFVSTEENPTYTYSSGGTFEVQLSSTSDPSCTAFHAQRIAVTGDDFVDFADTIMTCDILNIALNPDLNPFYIYAWQPDPAIGDVSDANPVVKLKSDRTFFVTVTDPLNDTCQIEGSVTVFVDTSIVAGLQEIIPVCGQESIQLNPNGNPDAIYMWSPAELLDDATVFNPTTNVTSNTTFSVVIMDPNDPTCTANAEVTVVFGDSADIVISYPRDMACPGDMITLSGDAAPFDSLVWFSPSGAIVGRGDIISFPVFEDGVYRVVGYKDDCTFTDNFSLMVRSLIFTLDPGMAGCAGDPVRISVTSNSDFLFDSVIWMPEESIALGQGSETVVVRPEVTSTYFAMMFFSDGCMTMDSVIVPVSDIDERFEVIADPDTIFFGEETTLIATDEPGAIYEWTPTDDLQTPNSSSTVAIPPVSGTYNVSITDEAGCMTEKEVRVEVIMVNCDRPDIFLPNAFTPNGDGQNDVLFVRGQYIQEVDFIIINRWGQKVFETNSQANGWDGTFNGELLPPDVYGYHLRVDCIGGGRHIEKGNITLLR